MLEDSQIPLAEVCLDALITARLKGKEKYPEDRWQEVLPSDNDVHLNAHAAAIRNAHPGEPPEVWLENVQHLIWRCCLALKLGRQ